jgi:diacylglycerol kinase family enzyme
MLATDNFAVMLNANARQMNEQVVDRVARMVTPENLYVSENSDDALAITKDISARAIPTVFTGGGDGTFARFVNDWTSVGGSPLPQVGVLGLGTGNAVAGMVSSGNYEVDLNSYLNTAHRDIAPLQLVSVDGDAKVPFGGLGLDAELLEDYHTFKRGDGLGTIFGGMAGRRTQYMAALFGKTLPRRMTNTEARTRAHIRITNNGSVAYALHAGEPVKAYGKGEVLYEGPATSTIFGTAAYFGYGLSALPYATQRAGFFQLRTMTMGVWKTLANLGAIRSGAYRGGDVLDWHVSDVQVEFERDVPFQHAGDVQSTRDSVRLSISEQKVDLLRFI